MSIVSKKMLWRVLAAAILLMAGLFVGARSALAATSVTIDGTDYTSAASGEGWTWDGADELVLDGYDGGAIVSQGDLSITLKGENTISTEDANGIEVNDGDLTITGEDGGSLSIAATGFYADGGIVVNDGAVTITDATLDIKADYDGIKAYITGPFVMKNTTYTAEVGEDGLYVEDETESCSLTATIEGCTIDITADEDGIQTNYVDATITDSEITVFGGEDGMEIHTGTLSVKDSTVTAKGGAGDGIVAHTDVFWEANLSFDAPALTFDNSRVEGSGEGVGINAVYYLDGSLSGELKPGTITILNSEVIDPMDGVVQDLLVGESGSDQYAGQVIGTGSSSATSWNDESLLKHTVIAWAATVTFDPNGGTIDGSADPVKVKVVKGGDITIIDAPVWEGHTFLGWKDPEVKPGDTYTANEDHTFVAQWKEDEPVDPGDDPGDNPGDDPGDEPGDEPDDEPEDESEDAEEAPSHVVKAKTSTLPKTGDASEPFALVALALASAGILFLSRREQH